MIQVRLWSTTLTIEGRRLSHPDADFLRALALLIDVEAIGPSDGDPNYALAARVLARFPEGVIVRADPPSPEDEMPGRVF